MEISNSTLQYFNGNIFFSNMYIHCTMIGCEYYLSFLVSERNVHFAFPGNENVPGIEYFFTFLISGCWLCCKTIKLCQDLFAELLTQEFNRLSCYVMKGITEKKFSSICEHKIDPINLWNHFEYLSEYDSHFPFIKMSFSPFYTFNWK